MTEIHRCCSRCIRRVPKARGAPPPMMSAQRHRCRRSTSSCFKNFRTDVAAASTSKLAIAGTRALGLAPRTVRGNSHRRRVRIPASWQWGGLASRSCRSDAPFALDAMGMAVVACAPRPPLAVTTANRSLWSLGRKSRLAVVLSSRHGFESHSERSAPYSLHHGYRGSADRQS